MGRRDGAWYDPAPFNTIHPLCANLGWMGKVSAPVSKTIHSSEMPWNHLLIGPLIQCTYISIPNLTPVARLPICCTTTWRINFNCMRHTMSLCHRTKSLIWAVSQNQIYPLGTQHYFLIVPNFVEQFLFLSFKVYYNTPCAKYRNKTNWHFLILIQYHTDFGINPMYS